MLPILLHRVVWVFDPCGLFVLIIGGGADAHKSANQSAEYGRHLGNDLPVTPPENFVQADKCRGASGNTDENEPLENEIYFIGKLHITLSPLSS